MIELSQLTTLEADEFVFSAWYFLIFYILAPRPSSCLSLSPAEVTAALATKLSVPPAVFRLNGVHKVTVS